MRPFRGRVKTPERLQMEAAECGAACLGIVLAYFGRWVSLEELRDSCGISRDGSNALMLKTAAQEYGLVVRAQRAEPSALKSMQFPLIVFWRFDHFLVVEGWSNGMWFLNDPAIGRRTCTDEEFDESFTGIVLSMTPGPDFHKGGVKPRPLRRLAGHVHGSGDGVSLMVLVGVVLIVPQILVPGLARVFVDSLAQTATISVPAVIGALVLAAILQAVMIGVQSSVGLRLALRIYASLSTAMITQLLRLPIQFHAMRGASTLAYRAKQPGAIGSTAASLFSTVAVATISSFTAAVILFFTFPPVGAVTGLALVLLVISQRFVSDRASSLSLRISREQTDVAVVTSTALAQIEVIKAAGAEDALITRRSKAHDRLVAAEQELGEKMGALVLAPMFISSVAGIAVTLTALLGVASGSLSLGGLVAVQTLSGIVLGSIPAAIGQIQQSQNLGGQLDQIDDVLQTAPDAHLQAWGNPAPGSPERSIHGFIEVHNVDFGYSPSGAPLLSDFSLTLEPGTRVALVGPSGCGKSTVSRLLVGWYQPWRGTILIDGLPRSQWPESTLSSYIALVDQDPTIFSGSIRDNITMWNPTIAESDVIEAAKDAGLHEDIARRPGAYEAGLAEFGADLSGGQRQRLEIARALVRNPTALILDEATSALDASTEESVLNAIRRRGTACLLIAHRLSTVRDCDEIIVLDQGRVVERGTHDDLLALKGAYSTLVRA